MSALRARLLETAAELTRMAAELREADEAADRLLKAPEAAKLLGVSTDTVYTHAAEYPFTRRSGRSIRFSEAGIRKHIREGDNG